MSRPNRTKQLWHARMDRMDWDGMEMSSGLPMFED